MNKIFGLLFLFVVMFPSLSLATDISSCQALSSAGTYTLTSDISSAGTCISIDSGNIIIDGAGHTINYSQSAFGYGINDTSGYSNITIKNVTIIKQTTVGSETRAIRVENAINITLQDVTVNITKGSSDGILFFLVNSSSISRSVIQTLADGILLFNSMNNTISSVNVTSTGTSGSGIYLYGGSSSNNLSNNIVSLTNNLNSKYALTIDSGSTNNNISSESYFSGVDELREIKIGSDASNLFSELNLTPARTIYFSSISAFFKYSHNASTNIWLITNPITTPTITRTNFVNWNTTLIKWNDSSSITANYSIIGLLPNTQYNIYNTSAGTTTTAYNVVSDSSGTLSNFSIVLNGNTEISVEKSADTIPPTISIQSPSNTTYTVTSIWFNLTINENGSRSLYSLDDAVNVTMTNSSGNWNAQNTTMNEGTHKVVFYVNDTAGNMGTASIYFTIDSIPPAYTDYAANTTTPKRNESVTFSAIWSDVISGLLNYTFSWNDTGSWVNETYTLINWSNVTKKVTANKNIAVGAIFYANDTVGNMNHTSMLLLSIANTAPEVSNVLISPSPAQVSDTLNCTYSASDIDEDAESSRYFLWYLNDTLSNYTTQNLTNGNLSANLNVFCSVRVYDGTNNSSWVNSSVVSIGDAVSPVLKNDSLVPSSGNTNSPFIIYLNITEANIMDWVYVEITTPDSISENKTMVQDVKSGNDYRYKYTHTPTSAGTYSFRFFARDGSGNFGNLTSSLTFVATSTTTVVSGGGGGGSEKACNYNKNCDSGESLSSCPQDCTFPFILKPNNITVYTFLGKAVISSFTLYNNVSWDVSVDGYFKPTKNDSWTYKLALFEIGTLRVSNFSSPVLAKSPLNTGYTFFSVVSSLPANYTEGTYNIALKAQGMEREYIIVVKSRISESINWTVVFALAGIIFAIFLLTR